MFLSSVLSSADIWYNLSTTDIKQLEDLDLYLIRKILCAPISVPVEALYLELGVINIETLVKIKRVNYLQDLVKTNPEEMLYKFFLRQWKHPASGDWTLQVSKDLEDFDIPVDLTFIQSKSKFSFHNLVKRKAKEHAFFTYLEKKATHSKLDGLFYSDLKLQDYLKSNMLTPYEAKTVFSYRVRAANYSANYVGTGGLSPCPICHFHLDCQQMAFNCSVIRENVNIFGKYESIFQDSVEKQTGETLVKIDKFRAEFLAQKKLV